MTAAKMKYCPYCGEHIAHYPSCQSKEEELSGCTEWTPLKPKPERYIAEESKMERALWQAGYDAGCESELFALRNKREGFKAAKDLVWDAIQKDSRFGERELKFIKAHFDSCAN